MQQQRLVERGLRSSPTPSSCRPLKRAKQLQPGVRTHAAAVSVQPALLVPLNGRWVHAERVYAALSAAVTTSDAQMPLLLRFAALHAPWRSCFNSLLSCTWLGISGMLVPCPDWLYGVCWRVAPSRPVLEAQGRGSLDSLDTERGVCNVISKYTPAYVRSRALETPYDTLRVVVSSAQNADGTACAAQSHC